MWFSARSACLNVKIQCIIETESILHSKTWEQPSNRHVFNTLSVMDVCGQLVVDEERL